MGTKNIGVYKREHMQTTLKRKRQNRSRREEDDRRKKGRKTINDIQRSFLLSKYIAGKRKERRTGRPTSISINDCMQLITVGWRESTAAYVPEVTDLKFHTGKIPDQVIMIVWQKRQEQRGKREK